MPGAGCATTGGAPVALGLVWVLLQRRRRLAMVGALLLAAGPALAAPAEADPLVAEPLRSPWSLRAELGASLERASLNVGLGVGLRVSRRLTLEVGFEFNPWFDLLSGTAAPGTLNLFGIAAWRWAELSGVSVSSALSLGGSALLFAPVGARPGSVGVFAALAPVRGALPLSPVLALELTPELVFNAPSLGGVPFVYREYRLLLGLRWDLPALRR
jgi:uncharacterized protein (TIGR03382 family)